MEIVHSFGSESSNDSQFLISNNNDKVKILKKIMNVRILKFISCFYQYNNFIKYQIMIFINYIIFNLLYTPNTYFQMLIDIADLFIHNTLIYYLANMNDKKFDTIFNILTIFFTVFIYYLIGDVKGLGSITFSNDELRIETFNTFLIILSLLCVIIFYNIHLAKKNNILSLYLVFILFIFLYILLFANATLKENKIIHIHHWFSGQILAIISRFDTKLSMLMHFFSLGIYLHGITFYDASFIYDDN